LTAITEEEFTQKTLATIIRDAIHPTLEGRPKEEANVRQCDRQG
jgi:hypothetical protein